VKHAITCQCEYEFSAEVPESVDLDTDAATLTAVLEGTFLRLQCPSCGITLKPEFPLEISWPSHALALRVLPEFDRTDFYRQKPTTNPPDTVIGYVELADRLAVVRDGLDATAVEALKYYLLLKAEEANPEAEVGAWYQGRSGESLEFHLTGIRPDEVAVSRVPVPVYTKTLDEFRRHPEAEPFASLRVAGYLSVQNLQRSEDLS